MAATNAQVKCYLVDPPGSGLLDYVAGASQPKPTEAHGVTHAMIPSSSGDTIAEGVKAFRCPSPPISLLGIECVGVCLDWIYSSFVL